MRLQRKIAEESLKVGAEPRERARHKIWDTAGAPAELRMAIELGEEWISVLLDNEEPLPAEPLLAIRAALQGPARREAPGAPKSSQDAVDITIPKRVKTEDITRYPELSFGNTCEPLPKSAEGKIRLQCTWKTADEMRKEVTFRRQDIKVHMKKKPEEGEPSDDDGGEYKRRGAGKSLDKDANTGKAKKRSVGCY